MTYKYNPKTKDSGIICAIPQNEPCPLKCEDCFFMSGRSYLEPLKENLPNMPTLEQVGHRVVRVNDGGDSSTDKDDVINGTVKYPLRFYNTAVPAHLDHFPAPVILTINPDIMTDKDFFKLDPIPSNLMFVRFRTNMWNLELAQKAVDYYWQKEVPIVLTFMAYERFHDKLDIYKSFYIWRKRTLNSYWAITTIAWRRVMNIFRPNQWVYSCGTEGRYGTSLCRFCGNCLREFYATKERMAKSTINPARKIVEENKEDYPIQEDKCGNRY